MSDIIVCHPISFLLIISRFLNLLLGKCQSILMDHLSPANSNPITLIFYPSLNVCCPCNLCACFSSRMLTKLRTKKLTLIETMQSCVCFELQFMKSSRLVFIPLRSRKAICKTVVWTNSMISNRKFELILPSSCIGEGCIAAGMWNIRIMVNYSYVSQVEMRGDEFLTIAILLKHCRMYSIVINDLIVEEITWCYLVLFAL